MSITLLPSDEIVTKTVPLLCKVVGIVFIMGGILELLLVPVLFFGDGESIEVLVLVLCVSAVFSIGTGIVVLKYMSKFMLSIFQNLRENPPF